MTKIILILSLGFLCVCSKKTDSVDITAEDVAWATDWHIFKKKLGSITKDPVYGIDIVVLDEEGKVISTGPMCHFSKSALAKDTMVAVAHKKTGDHVEIKLQVNGSGVSSQLKESFGNAWMANMQSKKLVNAILLLATDANGMSADSEQAMKAKGKKIGIKFHFEPRIP